MTKKIRFDREKLALRCRQPEDAFFEVGDVYDVNGGTAKHPRESFYIYKDNGAKILAVAHLDTVQSVDANWTFDSAVLGSNQAKQEYIWNAQLDDRLGVYTILDLLPSILGDDAYDILLTTDEESGATTAEWFDPPEGK